MSTSSELATRASTQSREQFVAAHPGLFLVRQNAEPDADIEFRTRVGGKSAASVPVDGGETGIEVLPLQKAPANPYPERISVGRARNCDIVLRAPSVSKLHAHFLVRPDSHVQFDLSDLDSHNGTKVNERTVPTQGAVLVQAGDTIYFGVVRVEVMDAGRLFDFYQRYRAY